VVLEEDIGLLNSDQETKGEVEIALSDNTRVELQAKLNQKSLVVLSDSYYPGWKTYIDEQETKILPVNINSRAVILLIFSFFATSCMLTHSSSVSSNSNLSTIEINLG